jgi:Ca2+-binding RTX toxin-like protein
MPQLAEFVSEASVGQVAGVDERPRRFDLNADGTYLASWVSDLDEHLAQVVQADGTPVSSVITLPNQGNPNALYAAKAVLLSDGTIGVSYVYYNALYSIKFAHFDSAGNQIGSVVDVASASGFYHDIAALPGGGAVVLASNGTRLYAHVFDATFTSHDSFDVGHWSVFYSSPPSITVLPDGNLVVVRTFDTDPSRVLTTNIQVFEPDGDAVGPLTVPPKGLALAGEVEVLADGGFVTAGASANGIQVYLFNADGTQQLAAPLQIARPADSVKPEGVQVAVVDEDYVLVTWSERVAPASSTYQSMAQLVHTSGVEVGDPFVIGTGLLESRGDGTFEIFTSRDESAPGGPDDAFIQQWRIRTEDIVLGTPNADTLSGLGGDKALNGFDGNDWYFVDSLEDVIHEVAGHGFDRVSASADYGVVDGNSIEQLNTTNNAGTAAINLVGNSFAQAIYGNAGSNSLIGNGGGDTLVGLGGDDRLYVVDSSDKVREDAGGGTDRVFVSGASYLLAAGQEIEVLSAFQLTALTAVNLTGNEFAQAIYGNNGANTLDGGGGGDVLSGLDGSDTYLIRDTRDGVREAAAGTGTDVVRTLVDFALTAGQAVERIEAYNAASTAALRLAGNELAQTIVGNAGANTLIGGGGADVLSGLGGNDMYYVSSAATVVNEAAGGGVDRVLASVSFVLGAGSLVETLSTANNAGTEAINLTGNALDGQQVYGNAGANTLGGGGGGDSLIGFAGDDRYVVVHALDQVYESAGGGNDRVLASLDYQLRAGAEVEVLSTDNNLGTAGIDLTGNAFAQAVYGNAGGNVLDGGAGRDTLIGLGGADVYLFDTALNRGFVAGFGAVDAAGNVDLIQGFDVDDKIHLDGSVFGLTPGALAGAFNYGSTASEADDRILYDTTSRALLFDIDGVGGQAAQLIAFIGNPFVLDATYIAVV